MKIRRLNSIGWRTRIALAITSASLITAVYVALNHHRAATNPAKVTVADVSGRPTACLAADTVAATKGDTFKRTWDAMRSGAEGRKINVQQLVVPINNPQQARPYLAGLLNQHCTVIVTIGTPFGQAIPAQLPDHPASQFVAIDAGDLGPSPQITTTTDHQDSTAVELRVASLARHGNG